jgi:hypothetical protein
MGEKPKQPQVQVQPQQIPVQQSQIQVPEDLRMQFQELSIRGNGYDIARRDFQVEINKTVMELLKKLNIQAETIRNLQQELANYKNAALDSKAEPVEPVPVSKKK